MDIQLYVDDQQAQTTLNQLQALETEWKNTANANIAQVLRRMAKASAKVEDLDNKTSATMRRIWRQLQETNRKSLETFSKVSVVMTRSFTMLSQIMSAFGASLDPAVSALIQFIFTAAEQFRALAAQYFAQAAINPFAAIAAAISMTSATISIINALKAKERMRKLSAEIKVVKGKFNPANNANTDIM